MFYTNLTEIDNSHIMQQEIKNKHTWFCILVIHKGFSIEDINHAAYLENKKPHNFRGSSLKWNKFMTDSCHFSKSKFNIIG